MGSIKKQVTSTREGFYSHRKLFPTPPQLFFFVTGRGEKAAADFFPVEKGSYSVAALVRRVDGRAYICNHTF